MPYINSIYNTLLSFLEKHCNFDKPILLGLSGGPDSLVLLHLLIKCMQKRSFKLGIAHIDHGWRQESAQEASILEELAKSLGLDFHLKKLTPQEMQGNLEAACRNERLQFFSDLCQKYDYQAVILGHHAGDQIETVLKKIFEGVSLPFLGGLQEITSLKKLLVWRPLLKFSKKNILEWVELLKLCPFNDRTNFDSRFLRSRMRTEILPYLSKAFGKQIETSLEKLSHEAQELKEYLDSRVEAALSNVKSSPRGLMLDLSSKGSHPFEIKHIIKQLCKASSFPISYEQCKVAVHHIINQSADKKIILERCTIHMDRGFLFLETFSPSIPTNHFQLKFGKYAYGDWFIECTLVKPVNTSPANWKDVWNGVCEVYLPQGNYHIGPLIKSNAHSISKKWSNAKAPAFLRNSVPLIWEGDQVKAEFLSERRSCQKIGSEEMIKISLSL